MKRCPECRRDYFDDSLAYCLDDGSVLLDGPPSLPDESPTALISQSISETGGGSPRQTLDDVTRLFDTENTETSDVNDPSMHRPPKRFGVLIGLLALVLASGIGLVGYRYFRSAGDAAVKSIAVLPFQNRSDDADTDYLSDGLAESLIFRLSQIPGLKVSPTSSIMRYKGKETDPAKIAAQLGVDAVLSGRLTKRGDDLGITVELVDTRDDKVMWGERYDRKMSDLLATQREIAATIVDKLQVKLSGNENGVSKKYTDNNEAYQLYLKGRFYFAKRTKEDLYKSIETFDEAVKLDPKFALAYVGIAESWSVIPSFPYASPAECIPKAKSAAQKALELDPELPEAHTVAAMIAATYDWDWAKAESEFKRSLELDPNLAVTHYRYAWTFLSPLGRHDEAVAEMRIAMEKEPLYLIQGANFAGVLMYARRYDEAVEQAKRTYDLDPNFFGTRSWLAHAYCAKGMYAEALSLAEESSEKGTTLLTDAGLSYAKTGQREKALAVIERSKQAEKTRYVINYWVAVTYAAIGDKDGAFAELEKAYQNHDWFLQRIKVDPFMDPLRDDPRFDEMVKRLKFPT